MTVGSRGVKMGIITCETGVNKGGSFCLQVFINTNDIQKCLLAATNAVLKSLGILKYNIPH